MIERAARSIYESRNGHGCKPWSLLTRSHKEPYLSDALAMFKAIREPTDRDFNGEFGTNPREMFTDMIDAALSAVRE